MHFLLPAKEWQPRTICVGDENQQSSYHGSACRFCKDRRREIEHKENIRIRQDTENGYSRSETLSKDIVLGTKGIKNAREEAMQSFEAFLKFFPHLPEKYDAKVLWRAWGGDNEALHKIYGEKIPAKDVAEMDIGMYLCNYNIAKGKELEK